MIDMPSFDDYLALKARVKKLEAKILNLNNTVCELRQRVGIKPRNRKSAVIAGIENGMKNADIARSVGVSPGYVWIVRNEINGASNELSK